jgi:hypothetical protein
MTTGLKYHTNEEDQNKMELREKPDTTKKVYTGSTKLPLPIASHLLEEKTEDQQHKAGSGNTPKPPSIYITDVKNISPLIQLSEQIVKQQYEIIALADNQVKFQPKTSESYRTIIKALAENHTEFHTYKLKKGRSYRVVLKNMHHSINPEDIKTEIEKPGHTVTNNLNIKQYRTKLPFSTFFVELKPARNNDINVEYKQNKTNKLHGLSPRANYTDRATAACRRSYCQILRIKGATWSA